MGKPDICIEEIHMAVYFILTSYGCVFKITISLLSNHPLIELTHTY